MTRWIHGISRDILSAAFGEYFGVSREHVDILVVLYARPGEWTPLKRLQILIDSHRPPSRQAVYERIRVLREAMEPESLLSGGQLDDLGYALSEVGYAECTQAIRSLVDVLLRLGPQLSIPSDDGVSPLTTNQGGVQTLHSAIKMLDAERPRALEALPKGDGRARAPLRTIGKAAS